MATIKLKENTLNIPMLKKEKALSFLDFPSISSIPINMIWIDATQIDEKTQI
jgi:hypothetical protein